MQIALLIKSNKNMNPKPFGIELWPDFLPYVYVLSGLLQLLAGLQALNISI